MTSTLNETGRLTAVLMKHARDAFVSQDVIDAQWHELNFLAPPDFSRAVDEFDALLDIVKISGAEISFLPRNDSLNLDSIYARDASVVCSHGVVACSMGKRQRRGEPAVQKEALRVLRQPVAGTIELPGLLEGGDLIWLDDRTLAVGQGLRTNAEGIRQLRALLADSIDHLHVVPLPDWKGPQDVMHLMSLVSPVDDDLAVVYSTLLPPNFRRVLLERGCRLVEVPDEEFESMGTNVLALAPRVCVMLKGNPRTRSALERAGAVVHEYEGEEISLKGGGGPTCLTRPLARSGLIR
jgi:N-dimethylarginine dimethylaminohydrolase